MNTTNNCKWTNRGYIKETFQFYSPIDTYLHRCIDNTENG